MPLSDNHAWLLWPSSFSTAGKLTTFLSFYWMKQNKYWTINVLFTGLNTSEYVLVDKKIAFCLFVYSYSFRFKRKKLAQADHLPFYLATEVAYSYYFYSLNYVHNTGTMHSFFSTSVNLKLCAFPGSVLSFNKWSWFCFKYCSLSLLEKWRMVCLDYIFCSFWLEEILCSV